MAAKSHIRPLFLLLSVLVFSLQGMGAATNSEASRLLVHTLNYIGTDYPNGVANGRVINKEEYTEMLGFVASADRYYHADLPLWPAADTAAIGALIKHLEDLIHTKAPLDSVAYTANNAKAEVIKASGLVIAPSAYPSLLKGKAVFAAECAKCHGDHGFGDGKEGLKLDPRPRNFHEEPRMSLMSPFSIYNTVRCGVQGTGMKAHPDLSDEEVWDAAFYVLTLRYDAIKDKDLAKNLLNTKFDSITLEQISTTNDKELRAKYHATKADLAILRYNQPGELRGKFIEAALKYIDESMTASRDGNYEQAERLSTLAYLEGIEPIEKQLASTDPGLMQRLEDQMANTRKAIAGHQSLADINDSLKQSRLLITQAGEVISATQYSPFLAFLLAISILLREGLEAFLVIMVILGVVKASGLSTPYKYIHAGWIAAILSGIIMWVIGGHIIEAHMAQVELMEGIIALVAVAMLLYIGFWLHGKSEAMRWKAYVTDKIKNITGTNSLIGLFALSFFVVFREVFESVLFLSAVNIESGGKQQGAIIAGVVVAFIAVITLSWLVLRFSTRLPIPRLFKISSVVMGALAVILAGKGIHSFQETGHIGIHGFGSLPRIELLGIFPTAETLAAQIVILGLVIFIMRFVNRPKRA
jgi:high-affinity iron transporter